MHLTDHISDVQLNEYLDNESAERAQIESHLASCADCAARLTALQTLFAEIESLPDLALSRPLAPRLTPHASALPRWLTLTAISQAALALIALILAAPFVMTLLPEIQTPSFTQILIQFQAQLLTLLDTITTYQLPTLPQLPPLNISSIMLTLAAASLLWLVGNGLLLRRQIK
ncbi:MAG: zf-HC2 domain-containing protein [Anaerolineales bacterium]|nr:zf-HC2 domain-containing protein [Anaerolineales bacterium]